MVCGHVAVGAGAPIRAQTLKFAVEERTVAPDDGVAWFTVAVGWYLPRLGSGLERRDDWAEPRAAGPDREHQENKQQSCGAQGSSFHGCSSVSEWRQWRSTTLSS
jgi:hypothetical protein